MKKFKLFKIFSIFAIAAAGAVVVGVGTSTPKVEAAEAANTTVYCKMTHGWWTADNAAIGVHYWGGTSQGTTWPGVSMTWLKDIEDGKKIFYIDVDVSIYDHILFVKTVDGSPALKTADINIATDLADKNTVYLVPNSWSGMDTGITVDFYNGTY